MDLFNILEFSWDWCKGNSSILPVLHMIKVLLNIIRIVVPIGLIAFTTFDVVKKVINPDDKDGQKKIMTRAIAALIVFLIPTIINLTLKVIDIGTGKKVDSDSTSPSLSSCWAKADYGG